MKLKKQKKLKLLGGHTFLTLCGQVSSSANFTHFTQMNEGSSELTVYDSFLYYFVRSIVCIMCRTNDCTNVPREFHVSSIVTRPRRLMPNSSVYTSRSNSGWKYCKLNANGIDAHSIRVWAYDGRWTPGQPTTQWIPFEFIALFVAYTRWIIFWLSCGTHPNEHEMDERFRFWNRNEIMAIFHFSDHMNGEAAVCVRLSSYRYSSSDLSTHNWIK